jgi:hypothetical protein
LDFEFCESSDGKSAWDGGLSQRRDGAAHGWDFALRSVKRHLEARLADISDMMAVIDRELGRRAQEAPATPQESLKPGKKSCPDGEQLFLRGLRLA